MIELEVLNVSRLRGSDERLLILRERDGARVLPITVGEFEARAILRAARRRLPRRPATHDLLAAVVRRLRARLERVVIHDLRDETFFCQLELASDRGLLEVDCRTSDAVALALRMGSPVFVTEEILGRAAVVPRAPGGAGQRELDEDGADPSAS